MRLAFLGTPAPAASILDALVSAGHEIALVVTRADKRRGRGSGTTPSPVKERAVALGLPVSYALDEIIKVDAELAVVVAYGRIIPAQLLEELTMVNVHFSLLPRWRGAAPVERALLAGDAQTGVCVMQVVPALDEGPVYARASTPIGERETAGELLTRLTNLGAELLVSTLASSLPDPAAQVGEPTYAAKLDSGEFRLDWNQTAVALDRLVRTGRAWTTFRGARVRVIDAQPVEDAAQPPGQLSGDAVSCGSGGLKLVVVQPAGKPAMQAKDWLNGVRPSGSELFGQ